MASLVLMGAILTGCSMSEEQQLEIKNNIVTVTTTISLDNNDATKALAVDYDAKVLSKTFSVGDKIALTYTNIYTLARAESNPLAIEDIAADGKSAKFTFTLSDPVENTPVTYRYPASLVADDSSIKLSQFDTQDGTLENVARLDYSEGSGTMKGKTILPSVPWRTR